MTTLLEARHVTKVFGGGLFDRTTTVALEDFAMAIDSDRPSITAIVGESGSGKTTLAASSSAWRRPRVARSSIGAGPADDDAARAAAVPARRAGHLPGPLSRSTTRSTGSTTS